LQPTGIAVDAEGAIWIACDRDNSLLRLRRLHGVRR
jgi:sugar lactone lactonase YvrE